MKGRHASRFGRASLAAVLLAFGVGAEPAVSTGSSTVIWISLDGVRHDYPERADTPAFDRMERDGARAARLVPVFPPATFPSHVSLATGTYPDVHGIVGNAFFDAERGRYAGVGRDASFIDAEPIWIAAERQGVRTAAFFWVGSETPWRGRTATYAVTPFDDGVEDAQKVEQILDWLDLPEAERPRLVLSWWHGADGTGHRRGPEHPAIAADVVAQDALLGSLIEGLDARGAFATTTLFVSSDHGMLTAGDGVDAPALLAAAGIEGEFLAMGPQGYLSLADPTERDAALAALGAHPSIRAYPGDAPPAELRFHRPGRGGEIVALAEPPAFFLPPELGNRIGMRVMGWLGSEFGMHGYSPELPEMGAIFYALGRGVPRALALEQVHAVDLAATVSRLLGIEAPAQSEGTPLPGIGSSPGE